MSEERSLPYQHKTSNITLWCSWSNLLQFGSQTSSTHQGSYIRKAVMFSLASVCRCSKTYKHWDSSAPCAPRKPKQKRKACKVQQKWLLYFDPLVRQVYKIFFSLSYTHSRRLLQFDTFLFSCWQTELKAAQAEVCRSQLVCGSPRSRRFYGGRHVLPLLPLLSWSPLELEQAAFCHCKETFF